MKDLDQSTNSSATLDSLLCVWTSCLCTSGTAESFIVRVLWEINHNWPGGMSVVLRLIIKMDSALFGQRFSHAPHIVRLIFSVECLILIQPSCSHSDVWPFTRVNDFSFISRTWGVTHVRGTCHKRPPRCTRTGACLAKAALGAVALL